VFVGLVSMLAAAAMPARAAAAIKIAVRVAMSPPGSVSQSVQVRDGTDVSIRRINEAGRPIVPIDEDTQALPEKAHAAVEKPITSEQAVGTSPRRLAAHVAIQEIEIVQDVRVVGITIAGGREFDARPTVVTAEQIRIT
jgi:hypothetical protein